MTDEAPRTWILTGSAENFAATQAHGLAVVGLKEGRRRQAQQIEPADRIVFYLTRLMRFAASVRVTGPMYEDRTPLWPGKPGRPDQYPWRFHTRPEVVPPAERWVPAEAMVDQLEHVAKWPRAHWTLAFQGQIRPVSAVDGDRLLRRLGAAAPTGA